MRRALVAGNWKMNGSREHLADFAEMLAPRLKSETHCDVAVCPPFPYLAETYRRLRETMVAVGAQTISVEVGHGAFTGEIPGAMLRDVGCRFAIVGHSERRHRYCESDATVADKFAAAASADIDPVLCIGETLAEHEAGATENVVERQLAAVLDAVEFGTNSVIAYEPVWAIGTGRAASVDDAQAVHAHIRGILRRKDAKLADSVRIVYGGSVKPANAAALFAAADIDGFLVGGASLDAEDFFAICQAAGC